ncbi:MAG TPA: NADH-quinone oxidoreductase subunit C [Tepidisphaeraceae bacterium]|jgi:NADH-quinone oxidoreductase subunit C
MPEFTPRPTALLPQAIGDYLTQHFGDRLLAVVTEDKHPRVHVDAAHWRELATLLKTDKALAFDWLACLGGVDYAADGKMAVVVDLWSTVHGHHFAVKAFCPRESPRVPSVADIWLAANWLERETWDLVGIAFDGHPDPRRILLADDWEGHPLRKDYVFPRQVNGIPGSVELDWQQKP